MSRFERTPTPLVYVGIVFSLIAIAIADLFTPLGVTIWVFYFVPAVLSFYVWRPLVPVMVAGMILILVAIGFFLSHPGIDPRFSIMNRSFGLITVIVLGGMGHQFIRVKLEVRREQWLQAGQTKLSEGMAGELPVEMLGRHVLKILAEYLDAQAGAMFVQHDAKLPRVATYGVPADAVIAESIQAGDGLLGQAMQDKRIISVHGVPEGYLTAGSGLGRSTPRHLLIAPLAVNGIVNTVLEFGFFQQPDDEASTLLARVSESIAIAARSAQYRQRLHVLLEETQRQAEELQMQSEELRVNNEELEEGSRALKESNTRLELQQTELEETNAQLEQQSSLLEMQKEDLAGAKRTLESQAVELRQASRYKSEFLANMSHELRTPLNASLILAKQLADNREGNLTAAQVTHARTIESAGKDLLMLINDVLDLAKVEAGHMDVRPQTVDVSRLLDSLRGIFVPIAGQKGLSLDFQIAPDVPSSISTDPQRLEQVLRNLMSNALKFTEHGDVALHVTLRPDGRIAFAVRDTGIGIAEHQHHMIFEPFRQADGTTNRAYGGTGLGLSICRQLTRLLGGEIRLSSALGVGSTFTVLLPRHYVPANEHSAPEPVSQTKPTVQTRAPKNPPASAKQASEPVADDRERLSGDRRVILIVEDDPAFAGILSDLAHELNFDTLLARMSAEAMDLAARYVPSAIVLDVGLPDHSGLSVLNQLKLDTRTRHIPVHVVSAHDYSQTALSLGAVGYALKPVKREQLIEAFERLSMQLAKHVRRILIVEDNAAQRESLRLLLSSPAVEIIDVNTAAACLEQLSRATFDCMVLDLNLPDATGFSLLDTLSREERYAFPPVIVYTGRELKADEEERLRVYSRSIIIKGAKSPERLLDEVTLFLHRVVADLPSEQQILLEQARRRDATLSGRRILIVEDDIRNIFALRSVLEPSGLAIHVARNGREALEALEQSAQHQQTKIDLVLMDIMMPEMDGLTAIREIRRREEWKKLPIIALTAKALRSDQEHTLQAGANDYMAKPLDVDRLFSLIRVWMPR
ncbi:chemotaxis protein CheY [Nitrospira sp. KM1]|uniref:response regulator n=1 Tax=Nitrospira sp. KM1 TaxID=1936990 RepID=UPI0013A743CC|nr:response regulator [Nitrospira sp. KM1]BCA56058.1 chemotaxis protein CheY [Nitrospira sp. KM1]